MSRRMLCTLFMWIIAAGATAADPTETPPRGDDKEAEKYESVWMQKKLEMSQGILEGLSRGELDKVRQSARTMLTLSKIEGWARRRDTREYRRQLKFFEQATHEIIRHCDDNNLDGATLAFTQMTVSCVACHQHLRDDH